MTREEIERLIDEAPERDERRIAWLREHYNAVGVTKDLRAAYERYRRSAALDELGKLDGELLG